MNLLIVILSALAGVGLGFLLSSSLNSAKFKREISKTNELAKEIIADAKSRAESILEDAKQIERKIREDEEYIKKREIAIDRRSELLDKKSEEIDVLKKELEEKSHKLDELIDEQAKRLENVTGMTKDEALAEMKRIIEEKYKEDLMKTINRMEDQNSEEIKRRARNILVSTIQRLAVPTTSEITSTTVSIPNDDIKGKIIGKEGRNIRAFERATGVELIIDDSPGVVTISSYDPIRRQIARVALENLIMDKRIQPARIEEFVENAKNEINNIIVEKGNWAVNELGIYYFDPKLIAIIGRLYFRTSYGQNVLLHSVEMAHLGAMIAEEVGANADIVKAGCLVHDIGKALDHELEGSHVEIGIKLLKKFNVDQKIIDAMKSHHDDYPHESIEAVIVQTADMISGSRPGARRDSLENYIKRLKELENLVADFKGVSNVYALSAGREVRVFVDPEEVDDLEAKKLAQDIAHKIESDLKYPGKIRVVLIRETRVVEYAL